jgi:transposase-like protein
MGKKVSKIEETNISKNKPRNTYDANFKRQVVGVWKSGAYATVVECAKSYNINENTLNTWLHESRKNPAIIETNAEIVSLKKNFLELKWS